MKGDEVLYHLCRQGDDEALAKLVEKYASSLTLFINGIVHNSHDAEELMLDTFACMVATDRYFEGRSGFKTWLFTIGRNLALQQLRRKRWSFFSSEHMAELVDEKASPEMILLDQEKKQRLYQAMNTMHADYAQVLYLIYFEEMSYVEAARVMKKTEKQITNLMYRAKQALKAKLEKEGFPDEEY